MKVIEEEYHIPDEFVAPEVLKQLKSAPVTCSVLLFPSYEKNLNRDVSVSLALFIYLSSSLVSIKYFYYFSRSSTSQQLMRLTRIKKINTRVAILMSMSCFAQVFFFFFSSITSI